MADKNGSLSLPKFEDRLWDELAERHAAENEPIRLDRGRHRGRYLLAAAAVAVIAAVGGVAVAMSSGGDETPTDVAVAGEEGESGVADESAADESAAEESPAQDGPPDAIVFVEQVGVDGSVNHRWTDETTGENRDLMLDAAGNPSYESAWLELIENGDGSATVKMMTVDHSAKEFTEEDWTPPMSGEDVSFRDSWREDVMHRDSVANGSAVEEGLEEVDGQELLRVVDSLGAEACATSDSGVEVCLGAAALDFADDEMVCNEDLLMLEEAVRTEGSEGGAELAMPEGGERNEEDCVLAGDLELQDAEADPSLGVTWVDPETYRPVKRIGYPGSDAEYTMTYEYLERTDENLELLVPDVHEGYTEGEPTVLSGDEMESTPSSTETPPTTEPANDD